MTVKLEKDMLEDVDNECEGLGCNRTDFIIEAVQEKLQGRIEDPQPKEEPKPKEPLRINIDEPKPRPKVIINLNDEPEPKQIDNSNKPPIQMTWFNGKILPSTKRFYI